MATRFWRESERRVDPYWSAAAGDQVAFMSVSNTVNWWRGEFPSFGEACEVGSFSMLGRERQYVDRPVQKKYLIGEIPREPLWNLNHGYSAAIRRDWTQTRGPCDVLSWIVRNADTVSQPSSSQKEGAEAESHGLERSVPDFACNRSLVARMLRTPFSEEAWQFKACRFRGIVHLQYLVTEEEREHRLRVMMNPWENRMSYWGLKFPQYMTSSEPDGASEEEAVLSEMDEYEVVVRNCLGPHKLLMNATMKAVDPRFEPGSTKGYVVFRTNRVLATHKQRFIFESHKLLEWWAYSVPIGVPRVMCGFRDDSGLVRTVEEFQVQKIPERAKGIWSDEVCLRFCDQVLWFVKEHVQEDDGRTVYHFEYQPSLGKIVCTRLADPEECAILPNWYLLGFNPTL